MAEDGPAGDLVAPELGSPFLVAEVRGRVLHLRIDRVERRNAFTQDMYRGIKRAAVWADEQPELDAVCLTGTDAWFGAGGDMGGRAEDLEGLATEWDSTEQFPFRHIERCRKLWVAKVNGLCHAGGLDQFLLVQCLAQQALIHRANAHQVARVADTGRKSGDEPLRP